MRVIAGIRKGLKLNAPDGMDTRPTTDRVKESVFNILQPYVPKDRVLDLFAGSGGLGIEALSRRCSHCTFVEHNRAAFSVVRQNIKASGFEDCSSLVFSDSMAYLDGCAEPYDIIFLDPPYKTDYIEKGQEEKLVQKYEEQIKLYKQALEKSLNRKVDKVMILSLIFAGESIIEVSL